ncbi:MAG: SDR family NAD(P)-dependent oxidoreductase [Chitinophagales bacterium]|nr:SDR family NAD(P)-dependent oxidoreductase [Chitinophagaceae bacterium]MCB9064733.1 SDR family NAD(P)-dependent oxidoreductase [Chitinophagales bacterium]
MKLNNNTILITGGTSGIGLAMAKRFISLHNKVIIAARSTDKLKAVKELLPQVETIQCDLSKPADIDKLVHTVEQEYPKLNVLINNAGVQYNYHFLTEADIHTKAIHEIDINLTAPIRLTAHLLPLLEQNGDAAIVNVSSSLGMVPKANAPVYCGTKAGIHIFSKALRYQLKDTKVFEVVPALVDTAMTQGRGKGKITPDQLVDEFVRGFERDKYEINIGKVKILRLLQRIAPALADRIISGKD